MDQKLAGMSFTAQDLAEQREFDLRVMFDAAPDVEAVFVHGRDDLYLPMLREAARMFFRRHAKKVVINGLSQAQCLERNLAYPGYEEWLRELVDLGIWSGDVILLPPSDHTGLESVNLIKLAQENFWEHLAIIGVPYHVQRCMLQMIGCMNDAGAELDVSAVCAKDGVDWDEPVTKIILGGGSEQGARSAHAASEVFRTLFYAVQGNATTRNATYVEGNEYFRKRNRRRRENKTG